MAALKPQGSVSFLSNMFPNMRDSPSTASVNRPVEPQSQNKRPSIQEHDPRHTNELDTPRRIFGSSDLVLEIRIVDRGALDVVALDVHCDRAVEMGGLDGLPWGRLFVFYGRSWGDWEELIWRRPNEDP